MKTIESDSFKDFVRALKPDRGPLSPKVREAAHLVWRQSSERGQDPEKAVRDVMNALFVAASESAPTPVTPSSRKAQTSSGVLSDLDLSQSAAVSEQGARLADQDHALQGGGRAWRDFPIKLLRRGKDWAGRYEEFEIEGSDGPVVLRMRRDPILLELPDERPRNQNVPPGSMLGSLVMAARRLALVYNWSEAEGLHFQMTGRPPKPRPLVARRLYGADGRIGASIAILAAAHVNPNSVKALFADEQRKQLRRDKRRGGRDLEIRNVELVRFANEWAEDHGALDFNRILDAWNQRWTRSRPKWKYPHASWVKRDYVRTAKAIFGRAPLSPRKRASRARRAK